jgi:[ribosomal protein S5]-alanine N-acetyltransferase
MPAGHLEIATARMRLRACSSELLDAAINARDSMESLLGARVSSEWPPPANIAFLRAALSAVRDDCALLGWGPWLMVLGEDRVLVGDAGFKGPPDANGVAELGYGVLPRHQRRGFATEAVNALITWAFSQGARAIVAESDADNIASARVLQKAGFRQADPRGELLSWRVEKG